MPDERIKADADCQTNPAKNPFSGRGLCIGGRSHFLIIFLCLVITGEAIVEVLFGEVWGTFTKGLNKENK